jgi:hypothetical protein
MSLLNSLRKGMRFFLMSFGVSSQTKKPQPAPRTAPTDKSKQ